MPPSVEALGRAGADALARGDAAAARTAFEQLIAAGQASPPAWTLLAQACRLGGDRAAERAAIERALALDPRNLRALIMQGDWFGAAGDTRAAASYYQHAVRLAPSAGPLPPGLAADLRRAEAAIRQAGELYQGHLEARLEAAGFPAGARSARIQESIDILLEKKQVHVQQPTNYYFPGLPQIQFYDRADFPWLAAIEQAVPEMRAELQALLDADAAFTPYVEAPKDRPYNAAHSLLDNADWTALYLWKDGAPVAETQARCPATVAALAGAPMPHIATRSPMVLFSKLRPHTHIPAHNGMLNTRLICHIPLIVPPDCRLRVGNEIRPVEAGKAMIFDDSIEHEAWNDSDETRVVLLFEVWRPELSQDERDALVILFEAINAYGTPESAA